ncbi:hypothetical protein EXIGLDRAFT_471862 [Exidia glandulosa HHB12029]|uniref:Uncharacterized protein n=1 Tax=Exidia glandulosa HHB12029 TaxID=1314781 RepID=A0A165ATS3_EXIGL|nr:hypothetical protein EXIGLDRAFT_471862 [Exidia glandulosa HHB12029]
MRRRAQDTAYTVIFRSTYSSVVSASEPVLCPSSKIFRSTCSSVVSASEPALCASLKATSIEISILRVRRRAAASPEGERPPFDADSTFPSSRRSCRFRSGRRTARSLTPRTGAHFAVESMSGLISHELEVPSLRRASRRGRSVTVSWHRSRPRVNSQGRQIIQIPRCNPCGRRSRCFV